MADKKVPLTKDEIAFIKEQTGLLAADLAFYARGPVRLHLIGGNQYGYTYDAGGDGSVINIHLNPSVLLEIRNRERAINVWRGLGFHELAHHLWPAHEQYKIAAAEGFKDLFNLIDDEQNERRGRSKDPSWGACFQTLVAWVIRKNKASRWKEVTGEGDDQAPDAGGIPPGGYIARFNEFLYHFRRHLPGPKDPVVAEALAMIPANLMDLSKDELLDLTRQVHAVLARGVEAPQPIPPAATTPPTPEPTPKPEPEPPETTPTKPPFWREVAGSKVSWLLLIVFVAGWFALFTHNGLAGWDSAFWYTAVGLAVSGSLIILAICLDNWLRRRSAKPSVAKPAKAPEKPKSLAERAKDSVQHAWGALKSKAAEVLDRLDALAVKYTPKPVAAVLNKLHQWLLTPLWTMAKMLAAWAVLAALAFWRGLCWLWASIKRWSVKVWRSPTFRALLFGAPLAALLAMIVAVILKSNWLALLILLVILLLLALLAWLFRKQIKQFVSQPPPAMDGPLPARGAPDYDESMLEFAVINNIVPVAADQASLDTMLPDVLPLASQMRRYLEQTGLAVVDIEDQETGHELIDEIERAALGETAIFVDEHKVPKASVHIEVGIDCSGSMAGQHIELAKRFGLLIEESVRGVRGITAHFWGFTDRTIYDCGTPGQSRVSGLRANGGNNDSAMLWHMYQSAASSGKELRILLMVSDGNPTECSWGSLHNLVCRLEMAGFVPVQIAVSTITNPAFERYFVDLVGQPMASAIIEFGRLLLSLVDSGK
jgi:hypothetical protein